MDVEQSDFGLEPNSDTLAQPSTPPPSSPPAPGQPNTRQHSPKLSRYIQSFFILLIAIGISWWSMNWGPTNPNHFSGGSYPFTWQWMKERQEENPALKLNVIDTAAEPTRLRSQPNLLIVEFNQEQSQSVQQNRPSTFNVVVNPKGELFSLGSSYGSPFGAAEAAEVYFENDTSTIRPEDFPKLDILASALVDNPQQSLLIEGHVAGYLVNDEEGAKEPRTAYTQEYAIALGERRANSVEAYLFSKGVSKRQISIVSYGKDKSIAKAVSSIPDDLRNNRAVLIFDSDLFSRSNFNVGSTDTTEQSVLIDGEAESLEFLSTPDEVWRMSKSGLIQHLDGSTWITMAATSSFMNDYDENWESSLYAVSPSPLAILISIVMGCIAVIMLFLSPESKKVSKSFLEDYFVNDAPISSLATDKLKFGPIAKSLSEFLRNERTPPPLTVAVTGQWGCGKSSLMKLLQIALSEHRLNPVWINAWHHQNESQFLAGLMEKIREEALPHPFSTANLIFQINLLWLRLKRQPVKNMLIFAPILLALGLIIGNEGKFPFELISRLSNANVSNKMRSSSDLIGYGYTLFALFSIAGTRISSITGNSWFKRVVGMRPKSLDLRSMVGLREQFVNEFKDICKALEPTTLTIFIDDLDRCNEKRILDILESVNFLVSSGNCFIVMGMEKDPVEKAIASYYRRTHPSLNSDDLNQQAKRYLEKMINIEVPVPETNPDQSQSLTQAAVTEQDKRDWLLVFKRTTQCCVFSLLFVWAGMTFQDAYSPEEATTQVSKNKMVSEETLQPLPVDEDSAGIVELHSNTVSVKAKKSSQAQQHSANNVWWLSVITVLFASFIVAEKFRQRKSAVETDSVDFEKNIEKWGIAVGDTSPTPRKIKRFINRTRFLAVRSKNTDEGLDEDGIVTLAALHEISPELFDNITFKSPAEIIEHLEDICEAKHIAPLKNDIETFCAKGQTNNIDLFKRWIRGIALRT